MPDTNRQPGPLVNVARLCKRGRFINAHLPPPLLPTVFPPLHLPSRLLSSLVRETILTTPNDRLLRSQRTHRPSPSGCVRNCWNGLESSEAAPPKSRPATAKTLNPDSPNKPAQPPRSVRLWPLSVQHCGINEPQSALLLVDAATNAGTLDLIGEKKKGREASQRRSQPSSVAQRPPPKSIGATALGSRLSTPPLSPTACSLSPDRRSLRGADGISILSLRRCSSRRFAPVNTPSAASTSIALRG